MSEPESQADVVVELAEEFLERYRKGERPSLREYIVRHPELAAEIREIFPAMAMMERIAVADDTPTPRAHGRSAVGAVAPLQQLGDYRIIRAIGQGGMGIVYEAEQVSLGRHVALKVLARTMLADPRAKMRFEREARAAAKLHHTNIVPVFGVGEHDGLSYYAMQFIQGLGLNEVLGELRSLQPGLKAGSSVPYLTGGTPRASDGEFSAAGVARSLLNGQLGTSSDAGHRGANVDALPPGVDPTTTQAPGAADGADTPVAGRVADLSSPSSASAVLPGSAQAPGEKPASYWQSVARIGVQVAAALEHAHQQGVLHRDIKPSNLLLDMRGTVWITDFGLAKADDQQDLTHTGDVLGTTRYMPPEAFDGHADARGDVYSLGLTLYELLALRPAFGERDRHKLVKQVTTTEPPRLDRLNRSTPRDLVTIVHKAIAREPSRRYPTAGEMAADLQRYVDDLPILARRMRAPERAWRWCRHNPLVASLLAAVALLLVAGTTVSTFFAVDATWARQRADLEARNAKNRASEAQDFARREAAEHLKAVAERERADREADAAFANLYAARLGSVQAALQGGNVHVAREHLELAIKSRPGGKEQPGWEWHYYRRLCQSELRTIRGDTDVMRCAVFSPDGTRLVSVARDGSLCVWDPATADELQRVSLPKAELSCVAFSPNGATLVVGGWEDGVIRLLDTVKWQLLRTFDGHTKKVRGLAFSPDGAVLVSASEDRTLKLWNVANGQELHTCTGHTGRVLCVAFGPDGQHIASGSDDRTLRIWDRAGRAEQTLHGHASTVYGVAYSPDGRRLATGSKDWAVKIWDASTGRELHTLTGHTRMVRTVAFSPDGQQLASAGEDHAVKVWDARTALELTTMWGHKDPIYHLAYSPDGRLLVSASADRSIRLWTTVPSANPRIYLGHTNQVREVAFSPDGRYLTSIGLDGRIIVRDAVSGQPQPFPSDGGPGFLKFTYSRDGQRLAAVGDAGVATVWDAATGRQRWSGKGHSRWANSIAFSRDGQLLATGGHDGGIKLWDAALGTQLRTLSGHTAEVMGLAFISDGRLISGSDDRTVKVWDLTTGEAVQTLHGHERGVTEIAVNRDETLIASASTDHTVKLWELASGCEVRTLKGHSESAWCVAFSPDGTRLASSGWDGTIRIWETASGHELAILRAHTDRVLGVAFSPDGTQLASAGGSDQTVRVWDGRPWTDQSQTERDAANLTHFLYSRPLSHADVIAFLRTMQIPPDVRSTALAQAERHREVAESGPYYDAAWPVIRHPHANAQMCRFAVAQLATACERAPDNVQYRMALGVAQYRLGRFEKERFTEALATLAQCNASHPMTLSFRAMTQHQRGQKQEARTTLGRVRETVKQMPWDGDARIAAFLREAETLIEGTKGALPK